VELCQKLLRNLIYQAYSKKGTHTFQRTTDWFH
jgi:hypothetical protein